MKWETCMKCEDGIEVRVRHEVSWVIEVQDKHEVVPIH